MAAEGQCRVTREEARRILRRLELDAYSAIVTAFRAQGDLSKTKKGFLQELASFLCISTERHRAEVRRVVSDDRLNSIAEAIHGYNTDTDWSMEGKRLVSLMPRLVPQTALTAKATIQANGAAVVNAKAAAKALEAKNAAALKESQKESQAKEAAAISGNQPANGAEIPKVKKKKKVQSNSTKSLAVKNHVIVTPKIVSGGSTTSTKSNTTSPLNYVGSPSKFHSKPIILQRNTSSKSIRIENTLSSTLGTPSLISSMPSTTKETSFQDDTSSLTNQLSQFVRKSQLSFRPPPEAKKTVKMSRPKQTSDFGEKKFNPTFSAHLDGIDILAPPQSFPMAPISPVKTNTSTMSSSYLQSAATVKLIKLPKALTSSPILGTHLTKSCTTPGSDDTTKSPPVQRMLTLANVQASLGQHNVGKLMAGSQGTQNAKLVSVTKSLPVAAGFKMIAVTTIVAGTTQVRTVYIATPIMSLTKTISQITSNVITTPAALSGRTSTGQLHTNLTVPKLPSTTSMQQLVTNLTGVSMPNLITCLANGTMTFSPSITVGSLSSVSSPVTVVISSATPKVNPTSCLSSVIPAKAPVLTTAAMTTQQLINLSQPKPIAIASTKESTIDTNLNCLNDKRSTQTSLMMPNATVFPLSTPSIKPLINATKNEFSVVISDAISTANATSLLFNTSNVPSKSIPVKFTSDPIRPIVHCSPAIPNTNIKNQILPSSPLVIPAKTVPHASPILTKESDVDSILLAGEKFLEELKAKQLAAALSLQNGNAPGICKTQQIATTLLPLTALSLPQPEPASLLQPEPASLPQPEPASLPQPEPASLPQPESASLPQPEPASLLQPEPASKPQPEPASLPQPEPASLSQPESIPLVRSSDPVAIQLDLCANESLDNAPDLMTQPSSSTVCHNQVTVFTQLKGTSTISNTVSSIANNATSTALLLTDKAVTSDITHPYVNTTCEIGTSGAASTDSSMDSLKSVRGNVVMTTKVPVIIKTEPIPISSPVMDVLPLSSIEQQCGKSIPFCHPINDVSQTSPLTVSNVTKHPSAELSIPSHDYQNNDLLLLPSNSRKRKEPGDLPPTRQILGWTRSAIVLLQKVTRYRGAYKTKGELNAAAWFIRPVDPKDAPGYFKLIKHPMDFGTVKKKLESGQYKEYSEFYSDMLLIKTNCQTYNPPEHAARKDCDAVFDYFEIEYQKLLERWHRCHVSPSKKQKILTGESLNRIETEP